MAWAKNRVFWPCCLLAALGVGLVSGPAGAQPCQSSRPTDALGSEGLHYDEDTEVGFLDSPSGRVRVHYALAGTHAPPAKSTLQAPVPDAVVTAARAADDALDAYEALGYRAPLGDVDSPCADDGGSAAVDVYMLNFVGADGQAVVEQCESGAPKRCGGFALVDNDFTRYASTAEGVRTVVPHELFHLVQDAYDADVERWWAEGSAQWAAKQVYPELRDLERFLPAYFENASRPLNVPPPGPITSFLYATAIWPVFLHERFDEDVVREVYETLGEDGGDVLPATDQVLRARGSSLADEYLMFTAFNTATGERATAGGGYRDAASYPELELATLSAEATPLVSDVMSGLGAYYYRLPEGSTGTIQLEADAARVRGLLVPLEDDKPKLDAAEELPASIHGASLLVVAGQSLLRTDARFSVTTSSGASDGGDDAPASSCSVTGPDRRDATLWVLGCLSLGLARRLKREARRRCA
jgi:hypothetical protein